MLCRVGDVGLVRMNRCGSRAVKVAVRSLGLPVVEISADEFNGLPVRAVNLRDPRERMQSAYRMFTNRGKLIVQVFPTGSFEEFVLAACRRPNSDPHTRLQSDYIAGVNLTHTFRWDFGKLAELLGTGPIAKIGAISGSPEWTERATAAFAGAYAADVELWNDGKDALPPRGL